MQTYDIIVTRVLPPLLRALALLRASLCLGSRPFRNEVPPLSSLRKGRDPRLKQNDEVTIFDYLCLYYHVAVKR